MGWNGRTERSTATSVLNAYDDTLCHAFDQPDRDEAERSEQQRRWAQAKERKKMRSAKHREGGFVLQQHVNDQQIPVYDAIRDEANKFVESEQFRKAAPKPTPATHPRALERTETAAGRQVVSVTRPLTPEHQHILNHRIQQKTKSDQAVARYLPVHASFGMCVSGRVAPDTHAALCFSSGSPRRRTPCPVRP